MRKAGRQKTVCFLSTVIILAAALTGCWGVRETDELAYILSTGIDRGKNNLLEVTFQIAIPQATGGGGGGGGEAEAEMTDIVSVESASFFGAQQLANAFVSRDTTFIHNRAVIISEELAREGIGKYLDVMLRSRDIRRNTFLVIARGKAREFIEKNKPLLEQNRSRQLELLLRGHQHVGIMPDTVLNQFAGSVRSFGREAVVALTGVNEGEKAREGKADGAKEAERTHEQKVAGEMSYLPGDVPREGGNKVDMIGLAAFRGDKLVGLLNGTETRYHQMVTGDFDRGIFSFPDPKHPDKDLVAVKLKLARKPQVKIEFNGNKPLIKVGIILEGEIMAIQSAADYDLGQEEQINSYLSAYLTARIAELIKKTQEEFQSDIFGFGEYARKFFWTWQEWVDYNWTERYPQADIAVQVEVRIRRTGLVLGHHR